ALVLPIAINLVPPEVALILPHTASRSRSSLGHRALEAIAESCPDWQGLVDFSDRLRLSVVMIDGDARRRRAAEEVTQAGENLRPPPLTLVDAAERKKEARAPRHGKIAEQIEAVRAH